MAEMKPHLAMTVSDVERAAPFYRALFDAEPAKVKPGYAKFEPADPGIVLTLIEGERGTASAPSTTAASRWRRPTRCSRRACA